MGKHQSGHDHKASKPRRRAAIVAGLRTPFVKAGGPFKTVGSVELSRQLICELMARTAISPSVLDRIVFGQVVSNPTIPNIAREVGLASGLPHSIDAYSVARACATSTAALVDATMAILCGDIDAALVGGVEMLSRPPLTYQDAVVDALMAANAAKTPLQKAKALLRLRPKDLLPIPPSIKEPSTGLTMGESCEMMVKENGIARADQDALALRSHQRATKAWADGIYENEVMSVLVPGAKPVAVREDGLIRSDTTLEKLSKLKPVFDRQHGTLTPGNSSGLTDGAGVLLVMEAEKAKAMGLTPLAYVSSWAFAAVNPNEELLAGPGLAIPRALARAGLQFSDLTHVDMHEAFAGQVLCNAKNAQDEEWQRRRGGVGAVGPIDVEALNPFGGSIALGHPFAATGARQVLTMANALRRAGGGNALVSQCAAGGTSAVVVLSGE